MPFKTRYFETRQQALKYFNIMSRLHIAFLALDKENGQYFVANEQDYRFFQQSLILICPELC